MRKILILVLLAHQSVSASLALWPNEETFVCLPEDEGLSFATPFLAMTTATLGAWALKRFLRNHEQAPGCKMLLQGKWITLPCVFDLTKVPGLKKLLDKAHNKKQAEKIFIVEGIIALIYQVGRAKIAFHYNKKNELLVWLADREEKFSYSPRYLEEEEVKLFLNPAHGTFKQKVGLEGEKLNFESLNRLLEEEFFYDSHE